MQVFGRDYSQAKSYSSGTHRSRSPEETLRDYGRFMPELGITRLANITGLDCVGIPVYVCVRPNARSLSVSQGKGIDKAAAKASAFMESLENWHAERVRLPLRFESYEALRREGAVMDIERLPLRRGGKLTLDRPMMWLEGWDILQNRGVWVPHEFVSMNTVRPLQSGMTFYVSTNGLASGNHLLEAIEHGLSELLERDAVAMKGLEGESALANSKIDPQSIEDPVCAALLAKLEAAGLEVALWDFTSTEARIPTFMAAIGEARDRPQWRRLGTFEGYGTHLSAQIALSRALTEAAQSRLTIIAGSRDDNPYRTYAHTTSAQAPNAASAAWFSTPPARKLGALTSDATSSFEGDIQLLLDAVRRLGLDSVVAVDLTHPDIGIPVAKVIVPGLELQAHGPYAIFGDRARAHLENQRNNTH